MTAVGEVPDRVAAGQAKAEPGEPGQHGRGPDHGCARSGDRGENATAPRIRPAARTGWFPWRSTAMTLYRAAVPMAAMDAWNFMMVSVCAMS